MKINKKGSQQEDGLKPHISEKEIKEKGRKKGQGKISQMQRREKSKLKNAYTW